VTTDRVYFFDLHGDERIVRVGFDGTGARLTQHDNMGQVLLALLPASQDFEDRIHRHFTDRGLSAAVGRSKSCYEGAAIWDYVTWLVRRGYAAVTPDDADHLPVLPWDVIDPLRVTAWFDDDGGQGALFRPTRRARILVAAKAAYHQSMSDEWFTPIEIIESARAVLGEIDLDPASCPKANETVRATHFFSQRVDGLLQPWGGRVWMNPPYSRAASAFADKLVAEYGGGAITEAVALFNANSMTSLWFDCIYSRASALLVTRGRLQFVPGDPGQASSSPSTGSVIAYFGSRPDRFADEFRKHGTILTVRR